MPGLDQPLDNTELDELDELLLSLGERAEAELGFEIDSILCVSELDGFYTALRSGPETVPLSKWYPAVWAGHPPPFNDEAEAEHAFGLILRHMNELASTLHDVPGQFEPLFNERVVEGRTYTIVDEWCHGYLRGVGLCENQWRPLLDEQPEMLDSLTIFTNPDGWKILDTLDNTQIEALQAEIPGVVREIHAYWLPRRKGITTTHRAAAKTGRNDPCPCGSGRKYKQCCLH